MGLERIRSTPFEAVELTMGDCTRLEGLAQTFVADNLRQYLELSEQGVHSVDDSRWRLVKSKEAMRVYAERSQRDMARHARKHARVVTEESSGAQGDESGEYLASELPVMCSEGTLVGNLEDVMFGAVSPTLDMMRIKASYVGDVDGAALLASIVEPTMDDPFCSLVIKWMEMDLPLRKTGLVKNRDFVYMEATGIVQLGEGGARIGYHLLHSVHFPQTSERPHRVRGRFSMCGFFRQTGPCSVEHYSCGTIDPGGAVLQRLLMPAMATQMLAPLQYGYCGQMKKLTWMLQQKHEERKLGNTSPGSRPRAEKTCVTCHLKAGALSRAKCQVCLRWVCHSCAIKKHLSFLTPESALVQRRVVVCTACMLEGQRSSSTTAARDQLFGPSAYSAFSTSDLSETSSDLSWSRSGRAMHSTPSHPVAA